MSDIRHYPNWKEKVWQEDKLRDLRIGPAFPVNLNESQRGMSYRMWLIGQALAGACASNIPTSEEAALYAITAADDVIKQLSEEK